MMRLMTLGIIGIGVIIILSIGIFPQKKLDAKDVFTSDEIVWFGLDFTKTHFVGLFDQGFGVEPATGYDLRSKLIPAWNGLFMQEQHNFNLRRTFRKRYVYYDIASVSGLNDKLDPDALLNYNETKISKATIREMVKQYTSTEKKEGLGLAFIIENFNKNTRKAGLYVTVFDIKTKKVLLCEFMSGSPVGFGLRNYWAGAIKDILHWIDFYEYKKWRDKYYNNPPEEDEVSVLQNSAKQFTPMIAR